MVQFLGGLRIGYILIECDTGACRLTKKYWRLFLGISPHLLYMLAIVSANTIDTMYWKLRALLGDFRIGACPHGNGNRFLLLYYELHRWLFSLVSNSRFYSVTLPYSTLQ